MNRPTRQEQAQAILQRRGWKLASETLGRRARTASDFEEAFNLERIDLLAEIPTAAAMLALGRNVVGPRDGLYVLDEPGGYRVYLQEKGEEYGPVTGATFDEARDAVIDALIRLDGLPFTPEG